MIKIFLSRQTICGLRSFGTKQKIRVSKNLLNRISNSKTIMNRFNSTLTPRDYFQNIEENIFISPQLDKYHYCCGICNKPITSDPIVVGKIPICTSCFTHFMFLNIVS
tara:strand:- start:2290 stop:2613 length:324 start_codon:yes stop_codon:yes gene_type:complete